MKYRFGLYTKYKHVTASIRIIPDWDHIVLFNPGDEQNSVCVNEYMSFKEGINLLDDDFNLVSHKMILHKSDITDLHYSLFSTFLEYIEYITSDIDISIKIE